MEPDTKLATGQMIILGKTAHDPARIHPALDPRRFAKASVNTGALNLVGFGSLIAKAEASMRKPKVDTEMPELVAYQYPDAGWRWMWLQPRIAKVMWMIFREPGVTNHELYSRSRIDSRTRVSELRSGGIIITSRTVKGADRVEYHLIGNCLFTVAEMLAVGAKPVIEAFPPLALLELEREEAVREKLTSVLRHDAMHINRIRHHAWERTIALPEVK